ncbi:hypothetical protein RvY_07165 [Ramazzottius varieornatus]|uniref:Solute carrier family 25 member 40 n=1 Tax=Ramazzottius varieornatus TaxID=947166 RepID=A0A1D1V147_RAMVA|nr:hypothetical protein RvY_07165 [Ramazzottius varieornatus]
MDSFGSYFTDVSAILLKPDTPLIMNVNGITPAQQIIASSTGAMLTSVFTTPLDVVKVRLQSQVKGLQQEVCAVCYTAFLGHHDCHVIDGAAGRAAIPRSSPTPRFNGTLDTLVKVSRQEGVRSLWAGLPPTLLMVVPSTVLYFTTYEQIKYRLSLSRHKDSVFVPILAGAVARVCAVSVVSPVELIRTKLQSEKLSYRYLQKAVSATVKQDGILSLWRGWGPTVLRDVPFSCLYWLCYETFKSKVKERHADDDLPFVWAFACGATAGTIAGVATLPFDVVKTHRQIELGQMLSANRDKVSCKPITSTLGLMMKLFRERGITSLFSGVAPRIGKVAPSCAIMISSYEFFKGFFRRKNLEKGRDEAPVAVQRRVGRPTDDGMGKTVNIE